MKQWAKVMRQWFLWLLGDEPLPGKGTRAMLAGTLGALVILVAGGIALMPSSATPARHLTGRSAASRLPALAHTTTTTATPSFSSPTTAPRSAAARAAARARARTHRQGTSARTRRPTRTARRSPRTTTTTTNASSGLAAPLSGSPNRDAPAFSASGVTGSGSTASGSTASGATGTAATGTRRAAAAALAAASAQIGRRAGAPVSAPVPAVPLAAPLATNASTGVDASLVSWKAPDRPAVIGYEVFVGTAPGQEWPVPANGSVPVTGRSYLVTGLIPGQTFYFTVQAVGVVTRSPLSNEVSATPIGPYEPIGSLPGPAVSVAATPDGTGYWLVTSSGAVSAHGAALDYGSPVSLDLAAPVVAIVATADGMGYWEVAADGGVFAYGDARYEGSVARLRINAPIVGLAPTADGKGYWEVAADGGVFALGDAPFLGSLAGTAVPSVQAPLTPLLGLPLVTTGSVAGTLAPPPAAEVPAVGIVGDPATDGYWVARADGTVVGFGAPNLGPQSDDAPVDTVVGISASPEGTGYWEVTRSGGVYAYGQAPFNGSVGTFPLNTPVSGIAVDTANGGYWLISLDGGVFAFDAPFWGAG